MKILNIMLFKNLGGIEQAFLDYCQAIEIKGHAVIPVISKGSAIEKFITQKPIYLNPFGRNDPFALLKLKYFILKERPDIIIAHTTKDTALARKVAGKTPVISVSHGYNYKHLVGKQHIIAITRHMYEGLIASGHPEKNLSYVPNMITVSRKYKAPKPNNTLTFGFMGRLVPIKGCDIFLQALSVIKKKGYKFKAIIAGDGEEKDNISKLVKKLGLTKEVKLIGWVSKKEKEKFFNSIDIYCLTSHEETFSIAMLEAFSHSKAVISTATTGPKEIVGKSKAAIFCKVNNYNDLANKMEAVFKDKGLIETTSKAGYKIAQNYALPKVAKELDEVFNNLRF